MPEGPPKIVHSLRNCKVAEGTAARFECKIRGNPEPEVEWTREGKILRESKQLTFLYDDEDNCKLIITKGTSADVGEYKVTAWNIHGRATSTARLIIDNGLDEDSTASESELSEPEIDERKVDVRTSKFTKFYTVKEELGKGRFGVVFRCIENKTGKAHAAKIIKCAKEQDKEDVIHEIEIMNVVRPHRRLLTLVDAFATDTEMVIVTELVTGGELFEKVVEDEYIDEAEVCSYMKQILEGVQHMHDRDVLHLDLKPENIMLVRPDSKQIKLIDFGLARKYVPGSNLKIMFGTPEFVAPEVLTYDTITPATDLWSVGVIAYVLMSGLSPFMGETDAETLINVQMAEWDFDDLVFQECSPSVRNFISSLLVLEPDERATVDKCLQQEWITMQKGKGKKIKTDRLKAFTARRKWKKAMSAIRSTNFLKRLLGSRGSVGDASKPEEAGGGGGGASGGLLARVKAMHAAGVQAPDGGTPPSSSGFLSPTSAAVPFPGVMASQAIKEEHYPKKNLSNEVIMEERAPAPKGWGRFAKKHPGPNEVDNIRSPNQAKLNSKVSESKADSVKKSFKPEPKSEKKSLEPKPEPVGHNKRNEKNLSNNSERAVEELPETKSENIKKTLKPEANFKKKTPEIQPELKNVQDNEKDKVLSSKPGQVTKKVPNLTTVDAKMSPKLEPKFSKKDGKMDENSGNAEPTQKQHQNGAKSNKVGQFEKKELQKHDKNTSKSNDKSINKSAPEPKSSVPEKTNHKPQLSTIEGKSNVKLGSPKVEKKTLKEQQRPETTHEQRKRPSEKVDKPDTSDKGTESVNHPEKVVKAPQSNKKEDVTTDVKEKEVKTLQSNTKEEVTTDVKDKEVRTAQSNKKEEVTTDAKPQEDKKELPPQKTTSQVDKKDAKSPATKFGQAKKTPNKLGDKIGKFNQTKSAVPQFGIDYTKRNTEKKAPLPKHQGAAPPLMEFGISYSKTTSKPKNEPATKAESIPTNASKGKIGNAAPTPVPVVDEAKTAPKEKRKRKRKPRVQG